MSSGLPNGPPTLRPQTSGSSSRLIYPRLHLCEMTSIQPPKSLLAIASSININSPSSNTASLLASSISLTTSNEDDVLSFIEIKRKERESKLLDLHQQAINRQEKLEKSKEREREEALKKQLQEESDKEKQKLREEEEKLKREKEDQDKKVLELQEELRKMREAQAKTQAQAQAHAHAQLNVANPVNVVSPSNVNMNMNSGNNAIVEAKNQGSNSNSLAAIASAASLNASQSSLAVSGSSSSSLSISSSSSLSLPSSSSSSSLNVSISPSQQDEQITNFSDISGVTDRSKVRDYLNKLDWNLERATAIFLADFNMDAAMEKANAIEEDKKTRHGHSNSAGASHLGNIPISGISHSNGNGSGVGSGISGNSNLNIYGGIPSSYSKPESIQLRFNLSDNSVHYHDFQPTDTLWTVYFHLQSSLPQLRTNAFHLARVTPYQVYGDDKMNMTLKEAQLNTNDNSLRVLNGPIPSKRS